MRGGKNPIQGFVFRKPALTIFGICGLVGTTATPALEELTGGRSILSGGVVFSLFGYLFWLLAWKSAVRISKEGLFVDNLMIRHAVPWPDFDRIAIGYGIEFRMRDGRVVKSLMFGGSVVGQILGYRYTRKFADKMVAARESVLLAEDRDIPNKGYSRYVDFSVWPPLIILAVTEGVALLSMLIHK